MTDAPSDTVQASPLIFCADLPTGTRYYVAGEGFVAEDIESATLVPTPPTGDGIHLDWPAPKSVSLHCHAPFRLIGWEGEILHARWGYEDFRLTPGGFFGETFGAMLARVRHLRRFGGPFGPMAKIYDSSDLDWRVAYLNIEFILPPCQEEFLLPRACRAGDSPREILARIPLFGFHRKESDPQTGSTWHRKLAGCDLVLVTGFGSQPESLTLLEPGHAPLTATWGILGFPSFSRQLREFITRAKTQGAPPTGQVFSDAFRF